MEVCITNFGARIVSIMVPDRKGVLQDVVLGYDNIMQYADYQNFGSDFVQLSGVMPIESIKVALL